MRDIFYCPKCDLMGSDERVKTPSCPHCKSPMAHTKYSFDEWQQMDADQKRNALKLLKEATKTTSNNIIVQNATDENWKKDIAVIAAKVSVIETIMIVSVSVTGIAALIILLTILVNM